MEHKMWVLTFCTTLSAAFIVLRRTERDVTKDWQWSLYKVTVIIARF